MPDAIGIRIVREDVDEARCHDAARRVDLDATPDPLARDRRDGLPAEADVESRRVGGRLGIDDPPV
jgi:hypothetical protein